MVENQFDFMSKRSTTEAIYLLQRLTERYRSKETYISFLLTWKKLIIEYQGKCYGRLWREKRCVHGLYSSYTRHDYIKARPLSLYLFNLVLDAVIKDIQKIIPNCMHFGDDIILIEDSREAINIKLELWRQTLETKGFA
ncbi:hypothetical protein HKD37_02G006127 [Glycine soja]